MLLAERTMLFLFHVDTTGAPAFLLAELNTHTCVFQAGEGTPLYYHRRLGLRLSCPNMLGGHRLRVFVVSGRALLQPCQLAFLLRLRRGPVRHRRGHGHRATMPNSPPPSLAA